ncbi:cation:proton antiporter [Natrinema saccharevitans]|uniref:Cation:proton antiporter n=1 Tax=Natrinema saccharevitans TaxID=301967 RepID=A0A1S8AUX2_9EURY|nr:monovalent cation/H(+) antiporter subunit G [Natrinema saccharevitans]OLZ40465.1 cation:proton antiporter [Natrinema saccharevitans]
MIEPTPLQVTLETARFWAIVVLLGLGVFFTLVSTVGVLRLPDIYARAHTASQTDTLGAGFALAGVALAFGWQHAAVYTVLLLFFVFVTNPTAAHAIARSAAETGVEPVLAEEGETDEAAADTEGETR